MEILSTFPSRERLSSGDRQPRCLKWFGWNRIPPVFGLIYSNGNSNPSRKSKCGYLDCFVSSICLFDNAEKADPSLLHWLTEIGSITGERFYEYERCAFEHGEQPFVGSKKSWLLSPFLASVIHFCAECKRSYTPWWSYGCTWTIAQLLHRSRGRFAGTARGAWIGEKHVTPSCEILIDEV